MSLISNGYGELSKQAESALDARFKVAELTPEEILEIKNVSWRLFPPGYDLDPDTSEQFRLLARFVDLELAPPIMRSHRAFLGPFIIGLKKIVWRVLKPLLSDTIHMQKLFNRVVVQQLAVQHMRINAQALINAEASGESKH